jgi:drug/metabolite transporter (DMT)-like permease
MDVPRRVYLFLVVGLIAASQSGNLIRLGDAHPIAIAAWRLLFASAMLAPIAGKKLRFLRDLTKKDTILLALAGLALAIHFFAWIAAVQMTTVANAAMFFAINPVITALAAHVIFGERVSPKLFVSIALGVAGVAVIGGGDLRLNPGQISGDGAAVLCSLLFTVYFLLGKRLRTKLPTSAYVTAVYGIAAAFSFIALVFFDLPVADYTPKTWLCFLLMALIPTMIGHTSFNNALKYIEAGRISAATLSEPLFAGLVAYFAWDEAITASGAAGYALICASVLTLVLDRSDNGAASGASIS